MQKIKKSISSEVDKLVEIEKFIESFITTFELPPKLFGKISLSLIEVTANAVLCKPLHKTALLMTLVSCDDGALDVQQSYDFSLETMPVQSEIKIGESAEIRCTLYRVGHFEDATYTIRYFQPSGEGELKMDDGTIFLPNDRYPLTKEVFRLYYTSNSTDQQTIDIYIEDNAGMVVMLTFSFTDEKVEEENDIE